MDLRERVVSGGKWTLAASGMSFVALLVKNIVVMRFLHPEDMGLFAMLTIFLTIADSFADAGISAGIVQRQTIEKKTLSSLFWFNVIAGSVVFLVLIAILPGVVAYYREPRLTSLGWVLFCGVLLRSLSKQFEMNLQRDLEFRPLIVAELVSEGIGLLLAVVLAIGGHGVWALIIPQIATALLRTSIILLRHWDRYRPELHFEWCDVKPFVRFGGFQMAETLVRFFAQRIDILLLGRFLGPASLGLYNFSSQIISIPVQRINPIVTRVAFPVFAKIQHDQLRLQRAYIRSIRVLCLANAPLLLGVAVSAPWLVPLALGEQWTLAAPYIQYAALLGYMRSAANPSGSLLMALGRTDIGFLQNVILMAANVPAVILGVKINGGIGALWALILVQITLHGPIYLLIYRRYIGRCAKSYFWASFWPLLVSMPAFLIGSRCADLVRDVGALAPLAKALSAGFVSMFIFVAGALLFGRDAIRDVADLVFKESREE